VTLVTSPVASCHRHNHKCDSASRSSRNILKKTRRNSRSKAPAPVAVPCYFVGCITAPPAYFHVLIDRRGFYPALVSVTALLMLALALSTKKTGSTLGISPRRMPLVAASLIALALPLPGSPYFPLGSMVAYLPTAILNPNHDHISVLIGFPFFFAIYGVTVYFLLTIAIWASRLLAPAS
jgi:hypothetical protein